jgi:hypothetical protein
LKRAEVLSTLCCTIEGCVIAIVVPSRGAML